MECLQEQGSIFRSSAHVRPEISVSPTFARTPDVRFADSRTEAALEVLNDVPSGALRGSPVDHFPELPHSSIRYGLVYPLVVSRRFEPPCSGEIQHDPLRIQRLLYAGQSEKMTVKFDERSN